MLKLINVLELLFLCLELGKLVYYFFDIFIGYLPYFIWSKFKLFFVHDIVNELRYGKYKYKIDKKKFKKKLKQANKLKKLILKFQNMDEKEVI